jgi:hypothetical protein
MGRYLNYGTEGWWFESTAVRIADISSNTEPENLNFH